MIGGAHGNMHGFQECLPVAFGLLRAEEGWGSWGEAGAGGSLPLAGLAGRQENPPAVLGLVAGHVAGLSDPFRGRNWGAVCFDK